MSVPKSTSMLTLLLLLSPPLALATCYWQNSTLAPDDPYSIAPDDTACFPEQTNSPCCGTGWACLSDGICYVNQNGEGFYYRGTCTDRTWDSQQCPGWCFAQNANTSIPMVKCDTAQDWYCCDGDSQCSCDTGKNVVKLGDSQPSTVTVIGSTSWPGITSTTAPFTQTSPLVSDGTSTSESAGIVTSSVSTTVPTSTTTTSKSGSTVAEASSSAAPAPAINPGKSSSSDTGLAAGLGAGLGFAAVVIVALAYFLLRSRRRRNAKKAAGGPGHGSNDPMMQRPFYGQSVSLYSDHNVSRQPPELAGAGEYDRREMPTESNGGTLTGRPTDRAELGS